MPDLVQRPDGRWAEVAPTHCRIGHQHGPDLVLVGYQPCLHTPHRWYFCRQPGHDTDDASRWQYDPPVTVSCRHNRGLAAPDGEVVG